MGEQVVVEEKVYRLSRAGRRMAWLLLFGGVLIWLFALWTLKNTLGIGVRTFLPSMQNLFNRLAGIAEPLAAEEAIPAVIMLVLLVVVPLLLWNLIEELRASYSVGPAGITFRSLGVELAYPWSEIVALRPVDEEEEEPLDELVVRTSRLGSIRNPLVRFLHWQAYGRRKIPLYGGLEDREDLVARIRAFMAGDLPALSGEAPTPGGVALGALPEVAPQAGSAESAEAASSAEPAAPGPEVQAATPQAKEAGEADLPWAQARRLSSEPGPSEGEEG